MACWSSVFSCHPHNFSLDAIVHAEQPFDIFTVATPEFMHEHWPKLYTSFFDAVSQTKSRGFLVTKRVVDCDAARLRSIPCAVSNEETRRGCEHQRSPARSCGRHWSADVMMSQEKWVVVERFLLAGKRIIFAGADFRLLRPTRSLFTLADSLSADAIFDADATPRGVAKFTPDLFAFLATANAGSFVSHVRSAIHAFSHPLLREAVGDVLGPADQDVLHDVLLSVIYDFPIAVRTGERAKILFGRYAYVEALEQLATRTNWTEARLHPPPADAAPWHSAVARQKLGQKMGHRLNQGLKAQFGALDVTRLERGGSIVRARRLTALLSVFAGPGLTCSTLCRAERPRRPFAVHCGGKRAECLDLPSTCTCVGRARSGWTPTYRNSGTAPAEV